jgi:hypothetical protein
MSCCDNIILRMLPEPLPGVLCAELSDGSVVCFDRSYLAHCDGETRDLLQAGLMPQSMVDEYRRLKQRGGDGKVPFLSRMNED